MALDLLAAPDLEAVIGDEPDLDRPPYWPLIWPSAVALARFLVQSSRSWPGRYVLELGCGAGLVGIVAAELGARVVQTDYILDALVLARSNARRNGARGIRHVAADWRAWPLRASFDVVLASDVTYDRAFREPLETVLERTLAPGGTAYFTDPGRPPALPFFARLERGGWRVEMDVLPGEEDLPNLYLYRLSQ